LGSPPFPCVIETIVPFACCNIAMLLFDWRPLSAFILCTVVLFPKERHHAIHPVRAT
jgi:hypothetical protein